MRNKPVHINPFMVIAGDERHIPSWSVIVDGAIVYTGGYGRAKREADKRGGTLAPSATLIMVNV